MAQLFDYEKADFLPAKKAALAYTAAMMSGRDGATELLMVDLQRHFSPKQVVELSVLVAICLGFIPSVIPSWGLG